MVQTCALFSQSHRMPRTYLPGASVAGTRSWSEMSVLYGSRPEQRPVSLLVRSIVSSHGGGNWGSLCALLYGSGLRACTP